MNKKILMVLMALFATCVLVMPAFSMPDDGKPASEQNCNQIHSMMGDKMPAPKCCPSDKPAMGPDGKQVPPMMDGKPAPECCPCDKPAMGPDGKQVPPMMDGKPAPQGCPSSKPAVGPDGEDGN
jgi:hypothetical protein